MVYADCAVSWNELTNSKVKVEIAQFKKLAYGNDNDNGNKFLPSTLFLPSTNTITNTSILGLWTMDIGLLTKYSVLWSLNILLDILQTCIF